MRMPRLAAQARVSADVLRAVIATNAQWLASPFNDPIEQSDHPFRGQREIDLDTQSFAVIVVDHVEQTDAAAISQVVVHEVHRPGLVDLRGHGQRQRFSPHQTMPQLDPQVQFQFAVNPVDALGFQLNDFTLRRYRKHSPKPQLR